MKKKLAVIPIGPPGVGKDTVLKLTNNQIGGEIIGTGEYFRKVASEITSTGNLVPDEHVDRFMIEKVSGSEKDTIIINGYPRNRNQAESALVMLRDYYVLVIELRAPTDTLIQRQFQRGMLAAPEEVRQEDTDLGIIIHRTYSQQEELEEVFRVFARENIRIHTLHATMTPDFIANHFLEMVLQRQRELGLLGNISPKNQLNYGQAVLA